MSKMGISTYQSYCGAQIFDAVGLKADFVAKYFAGTHTRIEGVGLGEIAEETVRRHNDAFGDGHDLQDARSTSAANMPIRTRGEDHAWTAESVSMLQHAARGNSLERYRAFAKILNEQSERLPDAARPVPDQERRGRQAQAGQARAGRAGQGHRQALLDRRDVVRLDLARGAHHAGDRDEPDRRQVEHRRRRRGIRPLQAAARTAIRCARRSSRSPRAASA